MELETINYIHSLSPLSPVSPIPYVGGWEYPTERESEKAATTVGVTGSTPNGSALERVLCAAYWLRRPALHCVE